jgi:putative acyl-CoA dehydrogenase
MECLGGNGYVEESALARLYREAPLNGIWEGSANVICLDALRAIERSPEALEALGTEIAAAHDVRATRAFERARQLVADRDHAESQARVVVESLALATQAALMRRFSTDAAAEAFGAARLDAPGHAFGMLGQGIDAAPLLARVTAE